jgi:hypothetical protein
MRLTDTEYWEKSYLNSDFSDMHEHDVAIYIARNLQKVENKTSLEIGSFPGSFIPTVGRKGYIVSGVDYNSKNGKELPKWLSSIGINVGEFWTADILEFIKFKEIIKIHIGLIKPGGKVILTTPNFRGFLQYIPHKIFDDENLKKHYLPSMNPQLWKKILEENGFEVLSYGYFGGYMFWVDKEQKRGKMNTFCLKITMKIISQFRKILSFLNLESSAFSAYCGIVAVKKHS